MKSEDYIESLRKKRRVRKRRFLLTILIIILLFAFYFIAFKTNVFELEEIEIENNNILSDETIISTAEVNLGENLLSIKDKKIKKNLEVLPYIDSVEVERKLPNKIIIKVKERSKSFQIKLSNFYQLISSNGYVLENMDVIDQDLAEIINLFDKEVDLNSNIYKSLGDADLEVFFSTLSELSLLNKMHIIDFQEDDNIVITTKEGIVIDFGDLDGVEYKVKLLNEVMTDLRDKEIGYKKIIMNKGSNPIIIRQD